MATICWWLPWIIPGWFGSHLLYQRDALEDLAVEWRHLEQTLFG